MTSLNDLRKKLRGEKALGEKPVRVSELDEAMENLEMMVDDKWAYLPLLVEGMEVLSAFFGDDTRFDKWQTAVLGAFHQCEDKKCVHCKGAPVPPLPVVKSFKPPGVFIGDLDLKKLPSSGDGLVDAAMATFPPSSPGGLISKDEMDRAEVDMAALLDLNEKEKA